MLIVFLAATSASHIFYNGHGDRCLENPCQNEGTCIPRLRATCSCTPFFGGRYCEREKLLCEKSRCNHGDCVLTNTPPHYRCRCHHPYVGSNCTRALGPCHVNPCQNGGVCMTRPNNTFACHCLPPYQGSVCETVNSECFEENGSQYRGKVSWTERNRTCLPWDSYLLVKENINALKSGMKEHGIGEHNYCRNPDGAKKPWCYYMSRNSTLTRDLCAIRPCSEWAGQCLEGNGSQYRGKVSWTEKKQTCLAWDSHLLKQEIFSAHRPGMEEHGIGKHNYCRNPGGAEKPWCYYVGRNGTLKRSLCNIRACEKSLPTVASPLSRPTLMPTTMIMPRLTEEEARPVTAQPHAGFSTCGMPAVVRTRGRIIGGKKVEPGRHPWQVSVGLKVRAYSMGPGHICGGSLITSCWVLSAAHCFPKGARAELFQISLGKHDIKKNETNEQIFDVEEVIVHEKYQELESSLINDIALLKLKNIKGKCAEETKYVKTICLPDREFPPGKSCFISGWGKTETENNPAQLIDASVTIISEEQCSEPQSYGKHISSSMLCAGILEGGVDACQGDSGGPLTCENDSSFQLAGVVSWGDGCGVKDKPGVYAHVYRFLPWIKDKMKIL
ncbi:hypothetical protein NDU88_006704 [Pleurodeles waltl]|uniref:T-plasminogen activator n=1 Tax=Pleurodeles waltl TaxID=8319 RepID=A0AAV7QKR6_PLEWA|nr:hypothetical protein NDU88_006704 [Pleurodeles waltl]